jgi:hypothetical protein
VGIIVLVAAVLAFTALQYAMPDSFNGQWELNHPGVHDFQRHWLGQSISPISLEKFTLLFRILLIAAWAGYALMLTFGLTSRGLRLQPRLLIFLIVALALLLALAFSCSLSSDPYVYVTYGRLQVIYGLNPYAHRSDELHSLGDPAQEFQRSPSTAPYGPVWVQICTALVWLLPRQDLWYPVLGIKLIGGASLVACALLARAMARYFSEDRADLTLLAIGLNPLFLIEGPGNGHNDLIMMALLLGGFLLCLKRKFNLACLLLGLSGGIKFFTWGAGPWVIIERARGVGIWRAIGSGFLTILFMLAPVAICYLPFREGSNLSSALEEHSKRGSQAAAMVQDAARTDWLRDRGWPEPLIRPTLLMWRQWLVVGLYFGITAWIFKQPAPGRLLHGWTILAVGLFFWTMGVLFPWYLTWFWMGSLMQWRRPMVYLTWLCLPLAVVLTLKYSFVW